jgi:UDP-N-acetylglucosamine:LPS N-acetylglucosamine transferase
VYYNHLPEDETIELLKKSETIITRSGYSTIMELISLGRSALLIPTPGQTEQEYLAEYLSRKGWFRKISQKDLDENSVINSELEIRPNGIIEESNKLLNIALAELLEE